jgi:hypothetical protein
VNEIKTKSPFLGGFPGKDPKLKADSLSRFTPARESPTKVVSEFVITATHSVSRSLGQKLKNKGVPGQTEKKKGS